MGSQWALEQAKYNLVNEYMLVGVTEELEDFVMMLEAALPRFFKGATELYKTGAVSTTWFKILCYCFAYFCFPRQRCTILKGILMARSHCSAKVRVCAAVAY